MTGYAPGRPVRREDVADEVLTRDEAPDTRVARRPPVVAHHQVVVLWDARVRVARGNVRQPHRAVVAAARLDVPLVELLAVDVDEPVALLPHFAWQADAALDERPFRPALLLRQALVVEEADVAPDWRVQVVMEP